MQTSPAPSTAKSGTFLNMVFGFLWFLPFTLAEDYTERTLNPEHCIIKSVHAVKLDRCLDELTIYRKEPLVHGQQVKKSRQ